MGPGDRCGSAGLAAAGGWPLTVVSQEPVNDYVRVRSMAPDEAGEEVELSGWVHVKELTGSLSGYIYRMLTHQEWWYPWLLRSEELGVWVRENGRGWEELETDFELTGKADKETTKQRARSLSAVREWGSCTYVGGIKPGQTLQWQLAHVRGELPHHDWLCGMDG